MCVCRACEHGNCPSAVLKSHTSWRSFLFLMTWPSQQFADVFPHYTIEIQSFPETPSCYLPQLFHIFRVFGSDFTSVFVCCARQRPPGLCLLEPAGVALVASNSRGSRPGPEFVHIWPPSRTEECKDLWVASALGSWSCVFLESKFPLFSHFISHTLKNLFYTISLPFQCFDVAISSLEAHLS